MKLPYFKKITGWIGLLVVVAGSPAVSILQAEPVSLRLWNIPPKGTTEPLEIAQRRCFEAFCRKYPEIKVQALVPMKIEGPAREGNEFLAVAGGVAPDVFYLYGRKVGDYYHQGFLEPLDSYLAESVKATGKPYTGINAPSPVWELCQIDGNIYCVPYLYYSMALMCRKDLFARAGVPLASPRDWEELYTIARRLTWLPDKEPDARLGDKGVYGLYFFSGIYSGWHMLQYIWSSGGEVIRSYYNRPDGTHVEVPPPPVDYRKWNIALSDADRYYPKYNQLQARLRALGIPCDHRLADMAWKLNVDTPQGAAVLAFYRRIFHTAWLRCENHHPDREFDLTADMRKSRMARCPVCGAEVDLSRPEGRRRVYTGVASDDTAGSSRNLRTEFAMRIEILEEISNSSDVTTLVPLAFPSRTRNLPPAALIAGHYLAINATQKDPQVRAAAWKYIEFMTGPEAQKIRVDTYVDYGLAPFIRPANLKALGYEVELERIPAARRALWENLERYARVEPYCRGFQHVMTRELGIAIDAILADKPDENGHFHRNPETLLQETVRRVNTMILGEMPKEILQRREKIGWLIGVLVLGMLGSGTYGTIRFAVRMHQKAADFEGLGVRGKTGRRTAAIVLFLTPAVGTILLWGYYPLLRGTLMAFQDFRILGGSHFVGLRNFVETVSSPEFWRYMLQTFEFLGLNLTMGFVAPIALAIFLTEIPRGKILFRTIYYLPAVTTGIVTLFLWKQLLYDSAPTGLINSLLLSLNDLPSLLMIVLKGLIVLILGLFIAGCVKLALSRDASIRGRIAPALVALAVVGYLGWPIIESGRSGTFGALVHWFAVPWTFHPQEFLKDPQLAMVWVILPTIWAGVGPGCLIYLAALKGIPEEQYEAADLDGAGMWSKITNVVFPNLSALILINLVGAVIGAMQASSNIFVMTGGGPEDVTMTVGLSVWFNAYMFLNFGLATAQAWILGALLIGFTLYQLRLLNRMQFRTTGARR